MLKPNIMQMLTIAKDMGIDHLEDAYNDYQRHYDLFFLIDDFAAQNKKFTEDLIMVGLVDKTPDGLFLKDVSVDEAIKIVEGFGQYILVK